MTTPTLSICIPTYNRADFLDYLLRNLAGCAFPFPIEIVISDNASTDATESVVQSNAHRGLPISYFRHPMNKGGPANISSVFHRARGTYFMYLADDDLLIQDAVVEAVQYLKDNPAVLAAYAPWELFDDVNQIVQGHFYHVHNDVIFTPGQDAQLLKFVMERHIFPEIVIYRSEALPCLIGHGAFSFQFFLDFGRVFTKGPIAFLRRPFYRSVTNSHLRRAAEQMGVEQVMTQWDSYRGGLEFFVYRCLQRAGTVAIAEDERAIRASIEGFIDIRMSVAQRLWLARREFVKAYEILCRRRFLNPTAVAQEAANLNSLQKFVAFQTLAHLANALVDIHQVLLGEIENIGDIDHMLRFCGLAESIKVRSAPESPSPEDLRTGLVLVLEEKKRQHFLDQGYLPGLVVSQDDLAAVL